MKSQIFIIFRILIEGIGLGILMIFGVANWIEIETAYLIPVFFPVVWVMLPESIHQKLRWPIIILSSVGFAITLITFTCYFLAGW